MNYSVNYNQANDWSHLSPANSMNYVDATYMTAYVNGTLAWGTEPGPIPADAGLTQDASASDVGGN
jgi:hypothetical protein